MIIAIDFDGTCVSHEYPKIGKDIGAVPVLKKLLERGDKLILYTMRSGRELDEAVEWFKNKGIALYGINDNPRQKEWTSSVKVYADIYIDDAGVAIPLIYNPDVSKRAYVDWCALAFILFDRKIQNRQIKIIKRENG